MKEKKILGICYAYNAKDEYDMVKGAGIKWLRLGLPFPWTDKMFGQLSERYVKSKEEIIKAHDNGMKIMNVTPGLGAHLYVEEAGETQWVDFWPDFCGEKGTDEYYSNVRKTCEFMANDTKGLVDGMWQIMNEIDIFIFRGGYSMEVAAETAIASAQGIMDADPEAKCGLNLSHYGEEGLEQMDLCYRPGHPFSYIGDDQYFGSWQGGKVSDWIDVIDKLHERYNLPVLVNEWGYSSIGELKDKPEDESAMPEGWPSVCYVFGWHHEVEGGHSEESQAEYLKEGLKIFATHPAVLGSFIFCFKDATHCYHCGQAGCPSECGWGIVDSKGKPKPAYYAVKEMSEEYYS